MNDRHCEGINRMGVSQFRVPLAFVITTKTIQSILTFLFYGSDEY